MSMLPVGIGSAEAGGFQIERSLRFNSADSTHLNRTFGTPTNSGTWTFSCWFKLCSTTLNFPIFDHGTANNTREYIVIWGDDGKVDWEYVNGGTTVYRRATNNKLRDPSAWYHLTVVKNSGVGGYIYINGVEASYTSTFGTPSSSGFLNTAVNHTIGRWYTSPIQYLNGYLTEINFIDGQALTPSSFGETDTVTGVWKPKKYTGTYGTNGFYLNFSDNSGTTSTTLGKDSSGNGNNWTPNNFSVTAGAGNDSLVDTPTPYGTGSAGGDVRGNYATLNVLQCGHTGNMSNGNLQYTLNNNNSGAAGTIDIPVGAKIYIESTLNHPLNAGEILFLGVANQTTIASFLTAFRGGCVFSSGSSFYGIGVENQTTVLYIYKSENGVAATINTSYPLASSSVVGIAVDRVANNMELFVDGVSVQTLSIPSSGTLVPYVAVGGGTNSTVFSNTNFGQRPFAYTAPSGFKALCTQNLPEPTIKDGGDYFNTILYTGTGSSNARTGVGFQPDFVWIKGRSGATDHGLYDAVRGVQKQLETNNTGAETTETTGLTAFGSDGFTVGALAQLNTSSATYVAWNWKANGAGSTNTAGTITSTVSVNTTSGFSIVTYSGNSVAGATVGHGLGVTPSMIIVKSRTASAGYLNWGVYHVSLGATKVIYLNTTGAESVGIGPWNDTAPTSTVFSLGNDGGFGFGISGQNYVAYCFAPVAGYSAFGSYTGNGSSTDGPFIYTGFRPRWVLIKGAAGSFDTGAFSWIIYDTKRDTYNLAGLQLRPNVSNTEISDFAYNNIDILSNGFKMRGGNYGELNGSGNTYIYAAFAENPFKYSLAR